MSKKNVLSKKPPKHIKLPKIKKQDSKDNLRPIDVTSRDSLEIQSTVKRTFLTINYDPAWDLKSVAFVENRELEEQYRMKKSEMKEESKHAVAENYAFIVPNKDSTAQKIAREGLKCAAASNNSLGDSKLGVYVCRNADIQLKLADSWKLQSCTLVMFKIVLGKCKSLAQTPGDDNMEPTPNFDCHIPQIQPRPSDTFGLQLKRSQVYLYEYTEDCEPSVRPRQCLPYAVLTYEKQSNIPRQSLSAASDSYSKRPVQVAREVDTQKTKPRQVLNNRDPRLGATEDIPKQEGDMELCVPHLTPGPPLEQAFIDPNDPRSQLSFLAAASNQSFEGYQYKPSFGPTEDQSQSEDDSESQEPQSRELPSSLPPIVLPPLTDPRFISTVNQPVDRPRDPRLSYNDPGIQMFPNDPRLRQVDPRLMAQRPRLQQEPIDPRLQQTQPNLPVVPSDPRVQMRSSIYRDYSNTEDPSKSRKKLSLSDYKKKVNITTKQSASPEKSFNINPPQNFYKNTPSVESSTPNSDLEEDMLSKADLSIIRAPLQQMSNAGASNTTDNQPRSPESKPPTKEKSPDSLTVEDIVEEPHDMMKTLNELSDPDDISHSPTSMALALNELPDPDDASMSPKEQEEPVIDDPVLAGAMQKLVEHSGNVSLFTEALRSLQESAEEFGEQLTDPEFLVKKIAEKIEALSNSEEAIQKPIPKEIQEISSPDFIMSPDRSNDSKSDTDVPMKYIPLENIDSENSSNNETVEKDFNAEKKKAEERKSYSKIEEVMQKTLEEYEKVEQLHNVPKHRKSQSNNWSTYKKEKERLKHSHNLLDIPVPPEPPKQTTPMVPIKTNAQTDKTKPLLRRKGHIIIPENKEEDADDDIKVTQVLPSLQEKKKPVISFNLRYKQKSTTDDLNNDVDLRVHDKELSQAVSTESKPSLGVGDKVFHKVKTEDAVVSKPDEKTAAEQRIQSEKKPFDMFEDDDQDMDHRKTKDKSVDVIDDPFGLGGEDVDERVIPKHYKESVMSKGTSQADVDWRMTANQQNVDIDLRSTDSSAENSQVGDLEDFDLRRSHSRSASPPVTTSAENSMKIAPPKVRKFVDPFGLDEDSSDRVIIAGSAKTREIASENISQESNSGSGVLFDAYSLSRSAMDPMLHANEFGDIDWRQAAAAEMGDFDMRTIPAKPPSRTSDVASTTSSTHTVISSAHTSDPFQQMNQNLQNMFNTKMTSYHSPSHNVSQSQELFQPNYITTNTMSNSGKSSENQTKPFLSNFAPSVSQQTTSGGLPNFMQNLDFSNLKNILATVQQPGTSSGRSSEPAEKKTGVNTREDKTENVKREAGYPETSSLESSAENTSKLGVSLFKTVIEKSWQNASFPGLSKTSIPGLHVSPEKDLEIATPAKNNATEKSDSEKDKVSKGEDKVSKVEDKVSKGEDKVSKGGDKPNVNNKTSPVKGNDSLPSTPKDKVRKDSYDLFMTPLPNISYQAAILESMEQSALKVRNDDSFMSEMEESPLVIRKSTNTGDRDKSKNIKRKQEDIDSDEEPAGIKVQKVEQTIQIQDDDKEHKALGQDDHIAVSDESDDDDVGLVIDLSPSAKSSKSDKMYSPVPEAMEMETDAIDLTEDVEPVLMIDEDSDRESKTKADDLTGAEQTQAKSKDEMKDLIETSRKNMVIKLKGETKLVNPQTGKLYSDSLKGSAIQVVGNPAISQSAESQKIHPIHGIIDPKKHTALQYQSAKSGTLTSTVCTAGNQKPTNVQPVNSVTRFSPISTATAAMNRTPSPVNQVSPVTRIPPNHEYIHPVTGQAVSYGHQQTLFQPVTSIIQGINMHGGQFPVSTMSQLPYPMMVMPPQIMPVLPPGLAHPRVTLMPPGLGPHMAGVPIPTTLAPPRTEQTLTTHAQQTLTHEIPQTGINSKSKDVLDWFSDKFTKRENKKSEFKKSDVEIDKDSDAKVAYSVKKFLEELDTKERTKQDVVKDTRTDETKNPIKIAKTDINSVTESIDLNPKSEDSNAKKRSNEEDLISKSPKKMKSEHALNQKPANDFGSKILETLSEVKSKLQSPQKSSPSLQASSQSPEKTVTKPKLADMSADIRIIKQDAKKDQLETKIKEDKKESGETSELEDGEISDDSMSESEEQFKQDDRRNVLDRSRGSSISVIGSASYTRGSSYSTWQQNSPRRIVKIRDSPPPRQSSSTAGARPKSAYKIGADWADIIQNPETRAVERVKATKIESPSLRNQSASDYDNTASLLSKSAASITKSKQKYKAQLQVKTLGEWLKLELEIDNIEPLQNIIPYPLDTDLTQIPKNRKRKIRLKVKNTIEQEGLKSVSEAADVVVLDEEPPKPLNPNYLPEVSNEQTEKELQLLGRSLNLLKEKVKKDTAISNFGGRPFTQGQFVTKAITESADDKKMIVAMTLVESEMRTHLSRTCFYGYPHRRVPNELLLSTELSGFKSEGEEVFLVLMMPLSMKPFNKLIHLKNTLQVLYARRRNLRDPAQISKIDEEIKTQHFQRQAVLRGFTGYLNKKRIQKLQETVDKYTLVYDYFKLQNPPTPDSMLRYIRTTQIDLRQHIILAKQYLALEEQKKVQEEQKKVMEEQRKAMEGQNMC